MSEKYYTLGTYTAVQWAKLHAELIADGNVYASVPSREVTVEDEKLHSPTRGSYLLTLEEATALKSDERVKFINTSPEKYPEEWNMPWEDMHCATNNTLTDRWPTAYNNYQMWTVGGDIVQSNFTNAEPTLNRTTALYRMQTKQNPWKTATVTENVAISSKVQQVGAGENVDIICADTGSWIGHTEFINSGVTNAVNPADYVGGNVLPGNGICDCLDLVFDAPYYIDPDWFNADPTNRLETRWDGTTVPIESVARSWWQNSTQRSASLAAFGNIPVSDSYTRDTANGSNTTFPTDGTHGTQCASLIFGRTHGWAYNANKWILNLYGSENVGSIEIGLDVQKVFHQYKPVNPLYGTKDPTLSSNSWITPSPMRTGSHYYWRNNAASTIPTFNITNITTDKTVVTTAERTSNVATLTTSAAHTLQIGDTVKVDISDATYSGSIITIVTILSVPSTTTFTYSNNGADAPLAAMTEHTTAWGLVDSTVAKVPGVLTTSAPHGLSDGDMIRINNIPSATDNTIEILNGKGYYVKVVDTTRVSLYYNTNWSPFNTANYSTINNGGTITVEPSFINYLSSGRYQGGFRRGGVTDLRSEVHDNSVTAAGDELTQAGVIFICAAGNDNHQKVNPDHPNYDNRISNNNTNTFYQDTWPPFKGYNLTGSINRRAFPQHIGKTESQTAQGNTTVKFPALIIGALDDNMTSSYDQDRKVSYSDMGSAIDLFAPADGTLAATKDTYGLNVARSDASYSGLTAIAACRDTRFSGTSAACPVAAGFLAIVMQYNRGWTYEELRNWIKTSVEIQPDVDMYEGTEPTSPTADWNGDLNALRGADRRILYQAAIPVSTSYPGTVATGDIITAGQYTTLRGLVAGVTTTKYGQVLSSPTRSVGNTIDQSAIEGLWKDTARAHWHQTGSHNTLAVSAPEVGYTYGADATTLSTSGMILSISKQSEAQVVTTTPHRLQNNSLIKFMGIKGMVNLNWWRNNWGSHPLNNYGAFQVQVINATTFKIQRWEGNPQAGNYIYLDTSSYPAYEGGGTFFTSTVNTVSNSAQFGYNDYLSATNVIQAVNLPDTNIASNYSVVDLDTSTRTDQWGDTIDVITHEVTITFNTSNNYTRTSYFEAGGQIRFGATVTVPGYFASTPKYDSWENLIGSIGTVKFGRDVTTNGTITDTDGYNDLTTAYKEIFKVNAGAGVYAENDYNIQARLVGTDQIQFLIEFRDDDEGDQRPIVGAGPAGPAVDEFMVASTAMMWTSTVSAYVPDSSFTYNGSTISAVYFPDPICAVNIPLGNTASPLTMVITAAEVSDGDESNDSTLSLTFTANRATTNFTVGDITMSGGSLSSFAGSGTIYTATFTPSGGGEKRIYVNAYTFTDNLTPVNSNISTQFAWTYISVLYTPTLTLSQANFNPNVIGTITGALPNGTYYWASSNRAAGSNVSTTATLDASGNATFSYTRNDNTSSTSTAVSFSNIASYAQGYNAINDTLAAIPIEAQFSFGNHLNFPYVFRIPEGTTTTWTTTVSLTSAPNNNSVPLTAMIASRYPTWSVSINGNGPAVAGTQTDHSFNLTPGQTETITMSVTSPSAHAASASVHQLYLYQGHNTYTATTPKLDQHYYNGTTLANPSFTISLPNGTSYTEGDTITFELRYKNATASTQSYRFFGYPSIGGSVGTDYSTGGNGMSFTGLNTAQDNTYRTATTTITSVVDSDAEGTEAYALSDNTAVPKYAVWTLKD